MNVPKGLLEALKTPAPLAYARADMTNDGELRYLYLLLYDDRLLFAVSAQSNEVSTSKTENVSAVMREEDIREIYTYPLTRLADAKIVNQVVGGLFVVTLDGIETWLCRFSSTRMREMRLFSQALNRLLCPDSGQDESGLLSEETEEVCPKCGRPYPEKGRAVCPHCMETRTIFRRVLAFFKAYRLRVVVLLVCVAVSSVLNAFWPYLSGTVLYDQILAKQEGLFSALGMGNRFMLMLLLLVGVMFITKLLQQLFGVLHGRMTAYMVPGVVCEMKNQVFAALGRLSIGFFTRRQTGSLMQRVNSDANDVMHFFIDGLPYLLFNVSTIVVSAIILFSMNWVLALVALCMLPPLFFVSYQLLPRLWHAQGRRARVMRSLYAVLNDNLTGARVVKAFGQEKAENSRFEKSSNRVREAEMHLVGYQNRFSLAYSLGKELPALLVWLVGALLILQNPGVFTYGKLLTFVGYLSMLQGPMDFFSQVFQWWSESMNAAGRVFEIIDAQPDVAEKKEALQVTIKGDVTLRRVCFGYEPNKPVLENVSFEVKAGQMLGIVGKSGAGKSTLVNLISRLYDADSGEVLLDGIPIKEFSFSSLRGAVAMVSQETYIFMGTVAENIAYACPQASRDDIVRAAIAASAHSFICRLPDGYDTMIGVGWRQLSGGERQRLSIARAILTDPQILVLDEATASVDTETERAIQASLEQLIQGRTTISIAHRLSTLRNADHLIVLENGKLVESGTHRELVEQRGVYYKLLQLQSKALAMRGVATDD